MQNQAALQYTQFATYTRNITNNLFYTPSKKSRKSAYLQIPGFLILFYFTCQNQSITPSRIYYNPVSVLLIVVFSNNKITDCLLHKLEFSYRINCTINQKFKKSYTYRSCRTLLNRFFQNFLERQEH